METKKVRKARVSESVAEMTKRAELMLVGLKANAEEIAKRGLSEAFATKMQKDIEDMKAKNAEQEKLKADLKQKTEEYTEKKAEVTKSLSEAKKVVKLAFPQSRWVEFGMDDKR